MKYDILNLSKIFEDFIDKHKEIDEIGRGMWYDEEPERVGRPNDAGSSKL